MRRARILRGIDVGEKHGIYESGLPKTRPA
jgi:hypothetical protein